jgi:hypothetical protein
MNSNLPKNEESPVSADDLPYADDEAEDGVSEIDDAEVMGGAKAFSEDSNNVFPWTGEPKPLRGETTVFVNYDDAAEFFAGLEGREPAERSTSMSKSFEAAYGTAAGPAIDVANVHAEMAGDRTFSLPEPPDSPNFKAVPNVGSSELAAEDDESESEQDDICYECDELVENCMCDEIVHDEDEDEDDDHD